MDEDERNHRRAEPQVMTLFAKCIYSYEESRGKSHAEGTKRPQSHFSLPLRGRGAACVLAVCRDVNAWVDKPSSS
jgi:hypothetical protein